MDIVYCMFSDLSISLNSFIHMDACASIRYKATYSNTAHMDNEFKKEMLTNYRLRYIFYISKKKIPKHVGISNNQLYKYLDINTN